MNSQWGIIVRRQLIVILVLAILAMPLPFFPIDNVRAADDDHFIWGMIFTSEGDILPYDTDFRVWVLHNGSWHPFPSEGGWDPVGTMGGWYSFTLPWDEKQTNETYEDGNWTEGDLYRVQIDCTPSGGLAENATSNGTGSAGDPVSPRGSYDNVLNWSTGGGNNNSQRWDVVCSNVDLVPIDIQVNGKPYFPPIMTVPFDTVSISAKIMNNGRSTISVNNTIVLRNDSGVIGEDTAVTIDEGSSVGPFSFSWNPKSGGDFCFNVTVDYHNSVTETNEYNNSDMTCVSIGILDVTFYDSAPTANAFPGEVNVSTIWLKATARYADVQVNWIDFTLGGDNIQPSEISSVVFWDDAGGLTGPDQKQQWFECELARNPVDSSSFRIPQIGNLRECSGLGAYVVEESETRYILVLLSVNTTAEPFVDRISISVDAINASGIVNGGKGTTKSIEVSTIYFNDDMESGQGVWTREGWDEGHTHEPEGLWHLSSGEENCKNNLLPVAFHHSDKTSWWYGHRYEDPLDPGTYICSFYTWTPGDYLNATRNLGNLTTPIIDATDGSSLFVTFWHLLLGEGDTGINKVDNGHVWLHDVANGTWHRMTSLPYDSTDYSWEKVTLNLSAFSGRSIQLEFRFDTVDNVNNAWLGWFIDDVTVHGKTIPPILPPASPSTAGDEDDVRLEWDASISIALDHYLIYRAPSQREFDFSDPIHDTSMDVDPLRTEWIDVGALAPGSSQEYYYTVRAVSTDGRISTNSVTAGKWTKAFTNGLNTFSLPVRPFGRKNISWYADTIPNVDFIRWMDSSGHWMTHYPSMELGVNDAEAKMGKAYEISVSQDVNFTFWGYPASMIRFHEGLGDSITFQKSLSARIEGDDVDLSWESVPDASRYEIFRVERRDGFHNVSLASIANTTETHWTDLGILGIENDTYYYMVIPLDSQGELGSSTYSVGVIIVNYNEGSDTFALPLKPKENRTLDWYCDNIPNVVGMAYLTFEVWKFHAKVMPEGVYDTEILQGEGYQISFSGSAIRYAFIGH